MFYKNKIATFVFLSIMINASVASASSCKLANGFDVLECALGNNPDILRSNAQIPVYDQYQKQSKKWFKPEVDAGLNYTKGDDDKGVQLELAVMQNIENPSKRKAQIDQAEAFLASSKIISEEEQNQTSFEVLTLLNRLRQISKEKSVVNEAIQTFENVLGKYKKIASLSPEDEISAEVFDMALKGYKIEYAQLLDEENNYHNRLKTMLNIDSKTIDNSWFLSSPKIWPDFSNDELQIENSVDMRKEKVAIDLAKANHMEVKASNFSGVNVGPYIATRPGDMGKLDTYGIKFSFPIPINSNKNGIKGSNFALKAAEQSYELKKIELEKNIEMLVAQYNSGKKFLQNTEVHSFEKRHKNVENLFATRRASASIFIEAHKQIIEATRTYNKYELETLQSLWSIYSIKQKLTTNFREVANAK